MFLTLWFYTQGTDYFNGKWLKCTNANQCWRIAQRVCVSTVSGLFVEHYYVQSLFELLVSRPSAGEVSHTLSVCFLSLFLWLNSCLAFEIIVTLSAERDKKETFLTRTEGSYGAYKCNYKCHRWMSEDAISAPIYILKLHPTETKHSH